MCQPPCGKNGICPSRYRIPADVVENKIPDLIKADLEHLETELKSRQYIAEEITRLSGYDDIARKQL